MRTKVYSTYLTSRNLRLNLSLAAGLVLMADAFAQLAVPYTASGTYTVPAGVTQATVECWGGGGRGGSRAFPAGDGAYGGGGGGAYARSVLTVAPGNYTVTVGAGSTSNSNPGGDSWFGTSGNHSCQRRQYGSE